MAIVVDIPGVGPTEFENEDQANSFFKSHKDSGPQLLPDNRSWLSKKLANLKYGVAKALQNGTLETAGTVIGGVGGGALGSLPSGMGTVPMGVAGAAMGAGAGKAIEDTILQAMDLKKPTSLVANLKSTGSAIARGATAEMAGQAGGKIISKVASEIFDPFGQILKDKVAPRIMQSAVKDEDLAREMLARNEWGKGSTLLSKADQNVGALSQQIDDLIKNNNSEFDYMPVLKKLNSLKQEFSTLPNRQNEIKTIDKYIKDITSKLKNSNTAEAQDLKKALYAEHIKEYQSSKFDSAAPRTRADMAAARGLKEGIEEVIPEATDINNDIGYNIQLRETMDKILNKANKADLVQLKPLLSGLGLMSGGAGEAVAAPIATSFLGSILGKTGMAVGSKKLGETLMTRSGTPMTNQLNKAALDQILRYLQENKNQPTQ